MKISSPAFNNNGFIPVKFTCDGQDINPQLNFNQLPDNVKSLALIVEDPDAPIGTWTHWILFDISPNLSMIKENSAPGKQGLNTSNKIGYQGPCPPGISKHRYFFRLYALDTVLELNEGVTRNQIDKSINNHIIESAEIMGYYSRKKE